MNAEWHSPFLYVYTPAQALSHTYIHSCTSSILHTTHTHTHTHNTHTHTHTHVFNADPDADGYDFVFVSIRFHTHTPAQAVSHIHIFLHKLCLHIFAYKTRAYSALLVFFRP